MRYLKSVKIIEREDGIMKFKVGKEKYKVKIDYSLFPVQQIEKFLRKQILIDEKKNMFILK